MMDLEYHISIQLIYDKSKDILKQGSTARNHEPKETTTTMDNVR